MHEESQPDGIRQRGEQAIGDLAQALLENPLFTGALSAAFGAREKAIEAQHAAMGALNLPSASEIERLERRLRSLSERLEMVEEQVDQAEREVEALRRQSSGEPGVVVEQASLQVDEG